MIYYQLYLEKNKGLYTYMDEKEEYHIGESVFVSFRNRKQVAYIIAKDSRKEFSFKVLPILGKTEFPNLPPVLVEVARWMVRYYVTSYEAVLKNIIPKDIKIKKKIFYSKIAGKFGILKTKISNKDFYIKLKISNENG